MYVVRAKWTKCAWIFSAAFLLSLWPAALRAPSALPPEGYPRQGPPES